MLKSTFFIICFHTYNGIRAENTYLQFIETYMCMWVLASPVARRCTHPRQIAASVVITGIAAVRYNRVVVVRGLVRRY